MAVESDTFDASVRRRKIGNLSNQSSSSDLLNNNNNEKFSDLNERDFDADSTTLDPSVTEALKRTTEHLPHDEALNKLKEIGAKTPILPSQIGTDFSFKREIVWKNAIGFLILHLCAAVGIIMGLLLMPKFYTYLYTLVLLYGSGLGVTMGAHRLWSHRSFKAKTPLKIFLLWLHTLAGQNCLYVWVRDHRQHHKYSDTDADPHNANRGFFFSHVGWLMSKKHPKVKEFGKKIDMSDLEADKYIMFQKDHYKLLYTLFALLLPTSIPVIFWNEDPIIALFFVYFGRAIVSLNFTWLVNSAAHLYGTRPFDKTIFPVENMVVAFFSVGEGWHNYHHAFPWDYRASELGSPLNVTGFFIDILANMGLIYDRREASSNMIKNRCMRTGDDSHKVYGTDEGRSAFTTLFNIWKHPSNPTYNSIYSPKPKIINSEGYALIEDELSKNEKDEDLLSRENEELQAQRKQSLDLIDADKIKKYIVGKSEAEKLIGGCVDASDKNVKKLHNNNEPEFKPLMPVDSDKSKLNIDVDSALFTKI